MWHVVRLVIVLSDGWRRGGVLSVEAVVLVIWPVVSGVWMRLVLVSFPPVHVVACAWHVVRLVIVLSPASAFVVEHSAKIW